MSDNSKIEWTDATWTPIRARFWEIQDDGSGKERIGWHCEHVSEGCRNCYAEGINRRLGTGLDFKPGNVWHSERTGYYNGEAKLFLDEKMLLAPLKWARPRMIFVCSMTDLFADFVPDEWIDRVFAIMALCPQHRFQVLTKRSGRMREYMLERWQPARAQRWVFPGGDAIDMAAETEGADRHSQVYEAASDLLDELGLADTEKDDLWTEAGTLKALGFKWPLPNVWLGVSAEDQKRADERIADLLQTPAAVRFVSLEPLLGAIDLAHITHEYGWASALEGWEIHGGTGQCVDWVPALDWVIVGGESGPNARPMHPDWPRAIRDQCEAAGVPFFFKQWGEWVPYPEIGATSWTKAWPEKNHRRYILFGEHSRHYGPYRWAEPNMVRVGKRETRRFLDRQEHNGMPKTESPDAR